VDPREGLAEARVQVGEQAGAPGPDPCAARGEAGVVGVEQAVLLGAREAAFFAAQDAVARAQELVVVRDVGDV
jgi:hypothetical protein